VSLPVRTTQIRQIDEWWRRNRPAVPELFLNELSAAFDVIGHAPYLGRSYRQSTVAGVRRVLLEGRAITSTTFRRTRRSEYWQCGTRSAGVGPPLRR
jgi:plasmid stabilization system protein ParE